MEINNANLPVHLTGVPPLLACMSVGKQGTDIGICGHAIVNNGIGKIVKGKITGRGKE